MGISRMIGYKVISNFVSPTEDYVLDLNLSKIGSVVEMIPNKAMAYPVYKSNQDFRTSTRNVAEQI